MLVREVVVDLWHKKVERTLFQKQNVSFLQKVSASNNFGKTGFFKDLRYGPSYRNNSKNNNNNNNIFYFAQTGTYGLYLLR